MYITAIVNSAYDWSTRFSFCYSTIVLPLKLAFIYELNFSFLCITVFEIKVVQRCKFNKSDIFVLDGPYIEGLCFDVIYLRKSLL